MVPVLYLLSNTGNTKTFVDFFKKHCEQEIEVCEDLGSPLLQYDKIALATYTWGNGKIPDKMKQFLINNKENLKGKEIFIIGSGLSIYPKFCGAVDGIKKIVTDCGADVIGTFKFEQRFNEGDFSKEELEKLISRIKLWSKEKK